MNAGEFSRAKRRVFTLVTLLLPFILLLLVELLLRATGFHGDLRLVVPDKVGSREVYRINRAVGRRYFVQPGVTVPEPAEDLFERTKSPRTKRIFCLGESTMAGFPYEFTATAPSFLRDRLSTLLPEYNIEVVNVGMSAVGSYVVLDFLDELVDYQPDLFIVYVGHNEFYGAYGVGSAVGGGQSPTLTRVSITLLHSRVFLLARDIFLWLRGLIAHPAPATGSLMAQVAADQTIPYDGPAYRQARDVYEENLRTIIRHAHDAGVPIMFSALVSNVRTQPPFVSLSRPALDSAALISIRSVTADADTSDRACNRYRDALRSDSTYALSWYRVGTCAYSREDYAGAAPSLLRAKDLDGLRFRATEDFQQLLKEICRSEHVPVSAADSAFVHASPHGIVGNELILEHLHPNIDGYLLLAKTWEATIRREGMLVGRGDWNDAMRLTDSLSLAMATVAGFDRALGRVKTTLLMRRWPFTPVATDYQFIAATPEESVVFAFLQKKIGWSDARYKLAEYYAGRKEYGLARRECLAVARVIPFSYQPLLRVADYYRAEGDTASAAQAYLHCLAVEENPFARMKLAIIQLEQGQASPAEGNIRRAIAAGASSALALPALAQSSAHYLLGVALAQQRKFAEARASLEYALAIDPNNGDARDLLSRLPDNPPTSHP